MKINEIQDLIKFVAKSGVSEVELEQDGFKIIIKAPDTKKARALAQAQEPASVVQAVAMPVQQQAAPPPAESKAAPDSEEDSKYLTVKSPMIGTFYRRPSPDKPLFVNVGDDVKEGQTVCIIEAMKLFNEIESEVSGKIVKILVEDNAPVEYDQPLFLVDPS